MTTHTNVQQSHKRDWVLHTLENKSGNAAQKTINNHSITKQEQQDLSWTALPLSLVVSRLRSLDHSVVLRAVKELRARRCLNNNTLSWICLQYANLQSANLNTANLQHADLHKANLERADLSYANLDDAQLTRARLQGANLDQVSLNGTSLVGANLQGVKNLSNEQLSRVRRLRVATMPDGKLYDGRFNLPGDYADASILHVDLNDPSAIAAFYGVSLEDFLRGQQWQQAHMPSGSAWHESICFQNAESIMSRF